MRTCEQLLHRIHAHLLWKVVSQTLEPEANGVPVMTATLPASLGPCEDDMMYMPNVCDDGMLSVPRYVLDHVADVKFGYSGLSTDHPKKVSTRTMPVTTRLFITI